MTRRARDYVDLLEQWVGTQRPDELLARLDAAWFAMTDEEREDVERELATWNS